MLLLAAAGLAVSAAHAGLYKWIDDDGVTHYSDQAPAKKAATLVEERVSIYQPDPALVRAMSAPRRDYALESRIELLERQLQRERSARDDAAAHATAAHRAAHDECVAQRGMDCDHPDYADGYAGPVIVVGRGRRVPPARLLRPITGVTAGNVVGSAGIMPGNFNGPSAITAGNAVTFGSGTAPMQERRSR